LHTSQAEGDAWVIRNEFQPKTEEGVGGEVKIKQAIVAPHPPPQSPEQDEERQIEQAIVHGRQVVGETCVRDHFGQRGHPAMAGAGQHTADTPQHAGRRKRRSIVVPQRGQAEAIAHDEAAEIPSDHQAEDVARRARPEQAVEIDEFREFIRLHDQVRQARAEHPAHNDAHRYGQELLPASPVPPRGDQCHREERDHAEGDERSVRPDRNRADIEQDWVHAIRS